MQMTRGELRDFIRSIHARPNGTGALLNLIRASEVRGAADLTCLADVTADDELRLDVTRHAADEARHAYLLVRRMRDIGFSPSRLPVPVDRTEGIVARCRARDAKRVYIERGMFREDEVLETLLAATLAEQDALPKLEANYEALGDDPQTQAVIGSILRDEYRHVAYLGDWMARFERRMSSQAVRLIRERLEEAFAELNLLFYASFEDYLRAVDVRVAA